MRRRPVLAKWARTVVSMENSSPALPSAPLPSVPAARPRHQGTWVDELHSTDGYDAAAQAAGTIKEGSSSSSKLMHKSMRRDYLAVCQKVCVGPYKVESSTAAHVSNFYYARTKQWKLGLSAASPFSAQMTIFVQELNFKGRLNTGTSASGEVALSGKHYDSDDVEKAKRAHKTQLAKDGKVVPPVDP